MKSPNRVYQQHCEPRVEVTITEAHNHLYFKVDVDDGTAYTTMVIPKVAGARLLETLAEFLDHDVVHVDRGRVVFHSED